MWFIFCSFECELMPYWQPTFKYINILIYDVHNRTAFVTQISLSVVVNSVSFVVSSFKVRFHAKLPIHLSYLWEECFVFSIFYYFGCLFWCELRHHVDRNFKMPLLPMIYIMIVVMLEYRLGVFF